MAQNPPAHFPRVTPYLLYEDVAGALEWLAGAFGFRERLRFTARRRRQPRRAAGR